MDVEIIGAYKKLELTADILKLNSTSGLRLHVQCTHFIAMMIRVLVIGILFQTVSMTMINSVISDISNDNIRDDVERIPTERCPVGWLMSSNNKCYVFALEPENQPDADRRCRTSNGRLLALESAADQTALTTLMVDTKLFLNTTFWTAGQKATGGWSWGAAPFTFTNWAVIPNITGKNF